jgi:NAD(P)-dependent dehydrogenase (short-subunit alcohol dehydrogenase family)
MRFTDRVALVTGAGSGIGRAAALRFAQEGAHVVVVDIHPETAKKTAQEIQALGGTAAPVTADVGSEQDSARMVAEAEQLFGKLQVLFANAGVGGGQLIQDMTPEDWDRVIRINLRGNFLTCKFAVPALIRSGGGAIVTMASSMAGWDTSMTGAAYMASKEGIVGLTKSLALQLGGYGIRVNAVCPGVIQTNLGHHPGMTQQDLDARSARFAKRIPLRRIGQPEDVAAAVAFLASEDARHITGSTLLIDGGQTLQSWSNAPEADAYPFNTRPQNDW